MPLRDAFDVVDWWDVREEADRRLTAALMRRLGSPLSAGMVDELAAGFHELQGMRSGREPDYNRLGVALAYTFKFMPFRVTSVAAALVLLQRHTRHVPECILDIGSGTDAVRLAIDLCLTAPHRYQDGWRRTCLVALESCQAMSSIGESIAIGPGLGETRVVRVKGSFDFAEMTFPAVPDLRSLGPFDLVILSAVLPYEKHLPGSRQDYFWNTFIWKLAPFVADPGFVIFISPDAKKQYSQSILSALHRSDQCVAQPYFDIGPKYEQSSYGLGPLVSRGQRMRRMVSVQPLPAAGMSEGAAAPER